jgi:hypothetical protein
MNLFKVSLIILLAFIAVDSAFAGTLAISKAGDFSTTPYSGLSLSGDNSSVPDDAYNIFVEGNLYLDYSVFSTDQDLYVSGNITLIGETVTIFSFEQEPTIPDLSTVAMFRNPFLLTSETGEVLLFSESPVVNGIFKATGSIVIGNYSSLTPVPLPASLVLLLSGIAACGIDRSLYKML